MLGTEASVIDCDIIDCSDVPVVSYLNYRVFVNSLQPLIAFTLKAGDDLEFLPPGKIGGV